MAPQRTGGRAPFVDSSLVDAAANSELAQGARHDVQFVPEVHQRS